MFFCLQHHIFTVYKDYVTKNLVFSLYNFAIQHNATILKFKCKIKNYVLHHLRNHLCIQQIWSVFTQKFPFFGEIFGLFLGLFMRLDPVTNAMLLKSRKWNHIFVNSMQFGICIIRNVQINSVRYVSSIFTENGLLGNTKGHGVISNVAWIWKIILICNIF